MKRVHIRTLLMAVAIALFGVTSGVAWAHCDTESGPVAVDARKALETGKFSAAAIWIGEDQNEELRAAFEQCLPVYQMEKKRVTTKSYRYLSVVIIASTSSRDRTVGIWALRLALGMSLISPNSILRTRR